MDENEIKYFVEAALLAAGRPLSTDQLHNLFDTAAAPEKAQLREAIAALQSDYEPRGLEIVEIASGYRIQVRASMADRLQKLWEERPPRYSRALFETLALIAYRQPMTRGEIEEIRGVSVSANIVRSLLEREWVRVVGHRDVPGRPAMFGTTRTFLDYFGLKKLDDLPPLADLSDWESLRVQLNLPEVTEDELLPESAEIAELPVAPTEDDALPEGAESAELPVVPTEDHALPESAEIAALPVAHAEDDALPESAEIAELPVAGAAPAEPVKTLAEPTAEDAKDEEDEEDEEDQEEGAAAERAGTSATH